ncbi:MAG: tetratricopeptide repeat protein [Rhodobiaceae bacterium]|nr:tetratricopeptide repeat protein [Nitrosomonadales bacterium]MBT6223151.1 tetratricopeptide repeat protein [Rhodobiaceae bacterium]
MKRISPSREQLIILLEHYQNGRFDHAEKLSVSITKEFPKHQFGWKVLGAVLKQTGRVVDSLTAMQKSVQLAPQDAEAHSNLGNTLKELGRLEEAEVSCRQAIALKPDFGDAHYNLGNTLKELGRLEEAEASCRQAIALKPDFGDAHYSLGNMLKELGRLEEAEASYTQAIALKPDFAEAHSNLGVTIKELGRLDEAEASYTQAIALRPNFAEARNNLGITLQELGRLDEAEVSLRQAIALKPDFAEAHSNLGNTLKELGRLDEAFSVYIQAINLNPDFTDAYVNLAIVINNVRFNSSNVKLYPPLIRLLSTGNFARPADLAPSILSLVKHDPMIKDLLLEKNFATSLAGATSMIGSIDKLTLLHYLMRVCPLPDLQFEGFFVAMRSLLLKNIDNIEASPELIYFLSTLSLHCFTNEYVYLEKDEETELVENLEIQITHAIAKSEQPEAIKILCLASYRPLHQYDWCQQLEALDHLEEVKSRLIKEPHAEKVIEADISVLGEMSDEVSLKVREQYEENPYPRWVKLAISTKAKSIAEVCTDINLHLHSESIKNVTAPAILIAGCGTGQHSIETASRFSGCYVTAVDLSLASLAYAQRKTTELGLDNLEYLQADILRLNHLEQEFDIIESMGVLHHMDKPMVGWRVLVDLLKPDGLMKIGLYSELARSQIVKARREIASLGIGTSATEIRNYRESLRVSESKDKKRLKIFGDFFSLSEFRDLIFHVQEHRFTLLQIKSCLNELGLNFCGFADKDTDYRFREFHGEGSDICDLVLWHEFEESHPDTFKGMYQFWCQKL